jgi:CHASE3 domain sensor protein
MEMPTLIKKIIITGFLILGLLSSILCWLFYREHIQVNSSRQWVLHTHEVIENVQLLYNKIKDAEIGQRNFIITGNEDYLQSYYAATISDDTAHSNRLSPQYTITEAFAALRMQTGDNPQQQERLNILSDLITKKLQYLKYSITVRRTYGMNAAVKLLKTSDDIKLANKMHLLIDNIVDEEKRLLVMRIKADQSDGVVVSVLIALDLLLAFLAIIVCYGLIVHFIHKRVFPGKYSSYQLMALTAALQDLEQGIAFFDQNGTLTLHNNHYAEFVALPAELRGRGTRLADIIAYSYRHKHNEEEALAIAAELINDAASYSYEYCGNHGRIIAIQGRHIPDFGHVQIYTDITEAKNQQKNTYFA